VYLDRMLAESGDVFPRGVMVLEIQAAIDFDARQRGEDRQDVDDRSGLPIWNLVGLDMSALDPEVRARSFRGSPEVRVRVLSKEEPELPRPQTAGMGPIVEFVDLMVTPYVDKDRCKGEGRRCRAEIRYSLRALGIRPFKG